MRMLHLLALCVLAIFSTSCASDRISGPSEALAYSVATRACGPLDDPAVAIYFATAPVTSLEPPAPYVRIAIWQSPESLAARSYQLTGQTLEGGAWYHSAAGNVEIATSGVVTVSSVASDHIIAGSVDLLFPNTGRIRREFVAEWIPRTVLCG